MIEVKLPPRFYADHRARDLPEEGFTEVVRQTQTYVLVRMDDSAYRDLLSDADFYRSAVRDMGADYIGLQASARATHRKLKAIEAEVYP